MIKNIKAFIRKKLHKLQLKRIKRKLKKKLDKIKENNQQKISLSNTNLLIDSKKKANYNMIMNSVKSKNSHIVLRNAHPGKKKEKQILYPKMFWPASKGTYIRNQN